MFWILHIIQSIKKFILSQFSYIYPHSLIIIKLVPKFFHYHIYQCFCHKLVRRIFTGTSRPNIIITYENKGLIKKINNKRGSDKSVFKLLQ